MRIFYAFLVMMTAAILFMLPMSEAIYDFKTDVREDTFNVLTDPGETAENITLLKPIYDDDTSTIDLFSTNAEDLPVFESYSPSTRQVRVSGLAENTTRMLTVSYDVYALTGNGVVDTLLSRFDLIWLILIFAFAPAALAAIFLGRA